MQAISKPASRKRLEPATGSAFLRQLGSTRAFGRGSRHLGWAARISARLTGRKMGLGWNSGWKVLARPARSYLVRREWIGQLRPVSSSHPPGTRIGKNRQRSCGWVQNITHLHITAVNTMGMPAASRAHETQPQRGVRAAAWGAAMVQNRSAAASLYFASSPPIVASFAHFFPAASEHPTRVLMPVLPGKRARVQPWLADCVIEDGSVATDMPSRVARKHRRIEHYAWPRPEDSVLPSEAWSVTANPRRAHEPQWRQPAVEAEISTCLPPMKTATHTQAEPVINVARITDEVIKQIDRRFLAARERRGKI